MIAVQKSQTQAVKALCQEFKCDKNAQDAVRDVFLVYVCMHSMYSTLNQYIGNNAVL